jgi:cytochrome c553
MTHALNLKLANLKLAAPALALALAALTGTASAQDAKAGEQKAAMCIGCHGLPGFQHSFPEVHKVPMISGQNAKYIEASLQAYKKGDRKHPTMRAIAESLSDKDMADLAAFYETHQRPGRALKTVADTPAVQPSAEVAALLAKGACASCHGVNFNKPIDGAYPKIAGQHADYLYVALKSYKVEGNPLIGRNNAIMATQVKQYTLAELRAMSRYIASLPGDLRVVEQSKFR